MKHMTTGVIEMMVMYYIQSWRLVHREAPSAVAVYFFGLQKTQFISGLIERTVHITQLGCPPLTDISIPALSCTVTCHKSKRICALRTAYSLAQWLNFHILSLQCAKCPPQPVFH